nr:hypothetical protein [Allomuricauda sp.]
MKKFTALLALVLLLVSCNGDDCDDFVPDILTQFLYIELVDANGANLIENGTYAITNIFTERNGNRFPAVVFTDNETFIAPEQRYKIEIGVVGNTGSNNTWTIELSDSETDTLQLNLAIESRDCNGTFYQIREAQYNDTSVNVEELGQNLFEIRVVK